MASAAAIGIGFGFQVWGQHTTWPALAAAARDIERLGFASLWSNDPLDRVADALRAYAAAGAAEAIIDWPAPFDAETLERLAVLTA